MNQIANYGNQVGNFIFVDTHIEGWQSQMENAMEDSLAVALSNISKVKLLVKNPINEQFEEKLGCEITYSDPNHGDEDKMQDSEKIFDVLIQYQGIQKVVNVNGTL